MIYTFWLLLAALGFVLTVIGLARGLTDDWDAFDLISFIFAFIVNIITALNAPFIEFISSTGSAVQYTGMWWTMYLFYGEALVDFVFTVTSMIVIIRTLNTGPVL